MLKSVLVLHLVRRSDCTSHQHWRGRGRGRDKCIQGSNNSRRKIFLFLLGFCSELISQDHFAQGHVWFDANMSVDNGTWNNEWMDVSWLMKDVNIFVGHGPVKNLVLILSRVVVQVRHKNLKWSFMLCSRLVLSSSASALLHIFWYLVSPSLLMSQAHTEGEPSGPPQSGRGVQGQYVYWVCMSYPGREGCHMCMFSHVNV